MRASLPHARALAGVGTILGVWLVVTPARAGEVTAPPLSADPVLGRLVRESLEKRPEIARVRAQITAENERVPQSHVLPDPTLSVGIQNDGFSGIQIGKMESSWLFVVASQTFPWFGKRDARARLAALGGEDAQLDLTRTLLSVTADVERGYLDLLLVREQLGLLTRLEGLWQQSEAVARVRYETGEVSQSDLLRAQLERARLKQRRWALESEDRRRVAVLNRLRGHDLGEAIGTDRTLSSLPDPEIPDLEQETLASEGASPELTKAYLAGTEADRRVDLAKKERLPDVTVSAGLMPRWGNFETMWQAGVSLNLPVWSVRKQARVIAENQARGQAARSGGDATRQLLRQRVRERMEALRALVETNRLYRGGLLTQSAATVSSTLLQYQVGRVAFASVLEALAGYLGDVNGHLESIAAAQRIAIAEREVSLDAPGAPAGAGLGATSMPGTGATAGATTGGVVRPATSPEAGGAASSSMSRM
jgi:outer membrane protein, heavy metal efflux system